MKSEEFLQDLVSRARPDRAPRVHVTQRVLASVGGVPIIVRRSHGEPALSLTALLAASAVAVAVACMAELYTQQVLHDPVIELVQTMQTVME